ncbi:MAG: zinc ribbon domain-containing protein [Clostridia bacterium]|nr:zinc ribbon domain-containing protein [Clostridia bacterium]
MYCSKCGAQNADNAVFCSACGSSYYVYSYLDATITVSTEYTYMSIDFD